MSGHLEIACPKLARQLPKIDLADLPTAVVSRQLATRTGRRDIAIKCDDASGKLYGGNKVRKLEYLLYRAQLKGAQRIATFGTVASNHALATALYAKSLDFECTCLLSNQARTANAPRVLNMHLQNGTEVVRYGGARSSRIRTLRQHLWNRRIYLIPPGGSNWLGTIGFVNAGLELAAQVKAGELDEPDRIYVANGTMATAVGLALGLALAKMPAVVQAIRVTESYVSNPAAMRRLAVKTATIMNRLDPSVPIDLADRALYVLRDEFLGDGYARSNATTDRAVEIARHDLGLTLESTYTAKALAAMLHDLEQAEFATQAMLFWNTYNSRPLHAGIERPDDTAGLPVEFLRYFD
jgi:1-aminocyclopropane-1-carboxylate deaminase/D-cysteine desulfhydrase-like pyridoxal-dependent ACC family enzyme